MHINVASVKGYESTLHPENIYIYRLLEKAANGTLSDHNCREGEPRVEKSRLSIHHRTEQNRAEQNRREQNRREQNRAEQSITEQKRREQMAKK